MSSRQFPPIITIRPLIYSSTLTNQNTARPKSLSIYTPDGCIVDTHQFIYFLIFREVPVLICPSISSVVLGSRVFGALFDSFEADAWSALCQSGEALSTLPVSNRCRKVVVPKCRVSVIFLCCIFSVGCRCLLCSSVPNRTLRNTGVCVVQSILVLQNISHERALHPNHE